MFLAHYCQIDTITKIKEYQVPQNVYFYYLYPLASMLAVEEVSSKSYYLLVEKFTIDR